MTIETFKRKNRLINRLSLLLILLLSVISCNKIKNENIEYYDNGERYKKTQTLQDGTIKVGYFQKDGTKEAEGYVEGDIENLVVFYLTGEIYEKGQFINRKKIGWHKVYHPDGKKMKDVFFCK